PKARSPPAEARVLQLAATQQCYAIVTFQKTGDTNWTTSLTDFRKTVGRSHSPHGTNVTSFRASIWICSARCSRVPWSAARTHVVINCSSSGTLGQPGQELEPAPDKAG